MHYYWMKKKWFFDIIVSNLLFAFVCLVDHSKTLTANIDDIDYAEVASCDTQSIILDKEYDVNLDIENLVLYPLQFVVEDDHINIDVEDITFNYIDLAPFNLDANVNLPDMEVFVSKFGAVHLISFDLTADINLPDLGISTIDFDPVNTVTFYLTTDVNLPDMNVILSEMRLPTTLPFYLTSGVNLSDIDISTIDFETLNSMPFYLTADINLPDLGISTIDLQTMNCLSLDFGNIVLPKYNINPSLYIIPVIKLDITEIQFYKMNVSAKIELASYVTRFSDLEGLIVEDLTGLKFRDLRNLAMA